jgi:hypothetical protein
MRLHLALRDTRGSVAICDTAAWESRDVPSPWPSWDLPASCRASRPDANVADRRHAGYLPWRRTLSAAASTRGNASSTMAASLGGLLSGSAASSMLLRNGSTLDNYRTPHTNRIHVVERFKMIEGGKTLQSVVTVDDPGAFNMAWSATQRWRRVSDRGKREPLIFPIQRSLTRRSLSRQASRRSPDAGTHQRFEPVLRRDDRSAASSAPPWPEFRVNPRWLSAVTA